MTFLLSGALLKMGAYGILRASGMLLEAMAALQPLLAGLALVSIVYGGLLAWRQSDLKAMIAYSSIAHMGYLLLGLVGGGTMGRYIAAAIPEHKITLIEKNADKCFRIRDEMKGVNVI